MRHGAARQAQQHAREAATASLQQVVAEHKQGVARGAWEAQSAARAKAVAAARQLALDQQAEEEARRWERQQLQAAKQAEERAREEAAAMGRHSPEKKLQEMLVQARELAARREAERLAQVEVKHSQQLANCDEMRSANSKRLAAAAAEEQALQAAARQAALAAAAAQERRLDYQHEQHVDADLERRALAVAERQKAMQSDIVASLEAQLDRREAILAAEIAAERQEGLQIRARYQQEEAMARTAAERMRLEQRRAAEDALKQNSIRRAKLAQQKAHEREVAIAEQAECNAAEMRDRERAAARRRAEAEQQQAAAEELAERRRQQQLHEERQLASILAAQQAKAEAEFRAKEDARRRLMNDVLAGRSEQLARQQAERAVAQQAAMQERKRAELAAAEELRLAAERQVREQRLVMHQKLDLEAQMVAKQMRQLALQAEEERELAEGKRQAALHQERVQAALRANPPQTWHGLRRYEDN